MEWILKQTKIAEGIKWWNLARYLCLSQISNILCIYLVFSSFLLFVNFTSDEVVECLAPQNPGVCKGLFKYDMSFLGKEEWGLSQSITIDYNS